MARIGWNLAMNRKRQALIVEDEVLISLIAVEALQELGFDAVEVGSARAAIDQADSIHFDVALVDIGLPDQSGDELVAELRRMRSDFPVIIATGYSDRALRDRFRSERHIVILNKPYDIAQIHAAIDALELRGKIDEVRKSEYRSCKSGTSDQE
jgi:DNA-binding response OmpR family regulator